MSISQRRTVKNKRAALTNTQRSQRRRHFMKNNAITEVRAETSVVEKELIKRVVKAGGYGGVSEFIITKAIEEGAKNGITPELINSESKLGYVAQVATAKVVETAS